MNTLVKQGKVERNHDPVCNYYFRLMRQEEGVFYFLVSYSLNASVWARRPGTFTSEGAEEFITVTTTSKDNTNPYMSFCIREAGILFMDEPTIATFKSTWPNGEWPDFEMTDSEGEEEDE